MPAKSKRTSKEAVKADPLYAAGDILAIYEDSYQDNFTFCVVKGDVMTDKDDLIVHLSLRADKPNIFFTIKDVEVQVRQSDVIAIVTDAKTTAVKSQAVTDSSNTSHNSTEKIAVTTKSYSITKTLASKFVPAPETEEEAEEDEDQESEEDVKPATKASKKVKKITGSKSATQAPGAKAKQRTTKG